MKAGVLNRLAELERKNQTEDDGARFLLAVKEVEAWFEGCRAAYNSPEAIREREEAYKESKKIGLSYLNCFLSFAISSRSLIAVSKSS